jgi:hypothetical protein
MIIARTDLLAATRFYGPPWHIEEIMGNVRVWSAEHPRSGCFSLADGGKP